jgi:hypothetical protein
MQRVMHSLAVVALLLSGSTAPARTQAPAPESFAAQVAALSEPGGYFDTDNLISNERSYLDVVPELRKRGVRGGVYLGVGPDQNFSYIAAVRPDLAFIVDIRRDNLLLHLLFKALFSLARTRIEYLSLLLGRAVPSDLDEWRGAGIDKLVSYLDRPALDTASVTALRARLDEAVGRIGIPLAREDLATIDRFHRRFIEAGTSLKFQSLGRPPQGHYPALRDLLVATTPSGEHANYLAAEESFQFVKDLQQRNRVIPVVGDLSGPRAIGAIAAALQRRAQRGQDGTHVSAFYVSNVEFYLFGDARFSKFVSNVRTLPRVSQSVIIRSIFVRGGWFGGSTSQLQPANELVDGFAKGRFQYYNELIGR